MTGPGVPLWGPFLSLPMREVGERLSRAPQRLDAGANATAFVCGYDTVPAGTETETLWRDPMEAGPIQEATGPYLSGCQSFLPLLRLSLTFQSQVFLLAPSERKVVWADLCQSRDRLLLSQSLLKPDSIWQDQVLSATKRDKKSVFPFFRVDQALVFRVGALMGNHGIYCFQKTPTPT